jgi:hypothetical protein
MLQEYCCKERMVDDDAVNRNLDLAYRFIG